jgi:excisionase family DNA binding protein
VRCSPSGPLEAKTGQSGRDGVQKEHSIPGEPPGKHPTAWADASHTDNKARLLDIRDVADYTGLSVHTLYTMVSQRRIPYVKVGRLTKFDRRLLDDWIKKNTVMPMPSKNP